MLYSYDDSPFYYLNLIIYPFLPVSYGVIVLE
jgi:hypothetical protein